jgi:tyrosyl-tRNA synthetase
MTYKSPLLQELHDRGFIYQGTDLQGLDDLSSKEKITLYIGYDATAPSLHVGNLMTIMMMRIAQRHGHKPIVLMGGGTTKVADPSGKDKARPPLAEKQIQQNIKTIRGVFEKYLDFKSSKNAATMVDNNDWLADLKYMDFLSEYGAMFSINRMLTFDSVKQRLEREQPLSFLEFNYMVLQGYDFLELYKKHDCVLQMGGSDQWGNILNGVELIHKALGKKSYGLTCPLITTSSGAKMGKSAAGAVWLNGDSLSPFDFWQYWRNTEDDDVVKFLKLYTDVDPLEIEQDMNQSFGPIIKIYMKTKMGIEDPSKIEELSEMRVNYYKELLADKVTELAHGPEAVEEIHKVLAGVSKKDVPLFEVIGCDEEGPILKTGLPIKRINKDRFNFGISAYAFLLNSGIVESGGEGRRAIREKSVKINGTLIEDENWNIAQHFKVEEPWVLHVSIGKKRHYLVQLVND